MAGEQLSLVHGLLSEQLGAIVPEQMPATQVSTVVHALPSLQRLPLVLLGLLQTPVLVLQVPMSWQTSDAVQVIALPPTQLPLLQVSPMVHALPSSQEAPGGQVTCLYTPRPWVTAKSEVLDHTS